MDRLNFFFAFLLLGFVNVISAISGSTIGDSADILDISISMVSDKTLGISDISLDVEALACFRLSFLLRALASLGSSVVENAEQVVSRNRRSSHPRMMVADSMYERVDSVCMRNFVSACHSASRNSNVMTTALWGSGSRPSKTGMAHWQNRHYYCISEHADNAVLTCSMSSKFRAASFFILEVLFENRRIVLWPKVGTRRNLKHVLA